MDIETLKALIERGESGAAGAVGIIVPDRNINNTFIITNDEWRRGREMAEHTLDAIKRGEAKVDDVIIEHNHLHGILEAYLRNDGVAVSVYSARYMEYLSGRGGDKWDKFAMIASEEDGSVSFAVVGGNPPVEQVHLKFGIPKNTAHDWRSWPIGRGQQRIL